LYELSDKVEKTGRATSKLDVHAKNVMNYIVRLYAQLELKLQGTKQGKYTLEELINAKDTLHEELDSVITDLMKMIQIASKQTEDASSAAQIVGSLITKGMGIVQDESRTFEIAQSGWGALFRSAFSWDSLSKLQRRRIEENLSLMYSCIAVVQETKRDLSHLVANLERFWEAANHARISNDRDVVMGLDAEDLLKLYKESLVKTREAIDSWK